MQDSEKIELEAAVFQRLVEHLSKETELQNIDLMNLAGFCRNCLSKWFVEVAADRGIEIDYDTAREKIYGMTYKEWKQRYQKPATAEQLEKMNQKKRS